MLWGFNAPTFDPTTGVGMVVADSNKIRSSVGVGLWNAYRGLTRKFEDKWNTGHMGAAARRWGGRVGVGGHLAREVIA